ncbi:unnamed protein product [Eruca vesicaria subsp. sativa]|uniref:Uncharacterized protein n=1 Tax=Eruca vesicaria subsp. sativa TaxID=29727 RepID=A0ABC8J4F0_ERUVS|nr:unnamed protein product [Eruca vesicaria subsp. sativa]
MKPMFYVFLAITAVLATTTNSHTPVLDIDGDIIYRGSYYVLPVMRGQGGGVTLSGRGNNPCPLDIVQESSEVDVGLPVKFSNWMTKIASVPESQNLNIETDIAATICVQSTYWWLDTYDKERKKWFVTAGPKPQGPGGDSFRSFFQIVKAGDNAYKFVFCPRDCAGSHKVCSPNCHDVGIFVDEKGVRRLALSNKPFLVIFKKAHVTEGSKFMAITM